MIDGDYDDATPLSGSVTIQEGGTPNIEVRTSITFGKKSLRRRRKKFTRASSINQEQ